MRRPFAYISYPRGHDQIENTHMAATYCRRVYEMGYIPICPYLIFQFFLQGESGKERCDQKEISKEFLRRSRLLVVCGEQVTKEMEDEIGFAKQYHMITTSLEGLLQVEQVHTGGEN